MKRFFPLIADLVSTIDGVRAIMSAPVGAAIPFHVAVVIFRRGHFISLYLPPIASYGYFSWYAIISSNAAKLLYIVSIWCISSIRALQHHLPPRQVHDVPRCGMASRADHAFKARNQIFPLAEPRGTLAMVG